MYFTVNELAWAVGVSRDRIRKWLRENVPGDVNKHEWRVSKKDAIKCIRYFVRAA